MFLIFETAGSNVKYSTIVCIVGRRKHRIKHVMNSRPSEPDFV